jgi:hypothetical protein
VEEAGLLIGRGEVAGDEENGKWLNVSGPARRRRSRAALKRLSDEAAMARGNRDLIKA